MNIIKRDGSEVLFDPSKIYNAISSANKDAKDQAPTKVMSSSMIHAVTDKVVSIIEEECDDDVTCTVEDVQDLVESELMKTGNYEIAKIYILYRQKRKEQRDAAENLMKSYNDLLFADAEDMDLKRDNANINTDAPMGVMLKIGAEGAKAFAKNYALPKEFADMHTQNYCHIHDMDFSFITMNCLQQDLSKTLKNGFSTGHGYLREPNSIRAAASLACIAIQSSQNDMFGGQSISALDFSLAPYIDKSFVKSVCHATKEWFKFLNHEQLPMDFSMMKYGMPIEEARHYILNVLNKKEIIADIRDADRIYSVAMANVEEETKQAMEAMVHNFNSLHSRAGGQVPFSSINYGMDTSPEGRLVTKWVLNAIDAGLGHGETPIFPISVFLLKDGINYNPEDPNYDLFIRACEVSAKRLFPNFVSVDSPYNLKYYVPGDYRTFPTTMGCRTKTLANVNGPSYSSSRGNFAFTTINLPMIALDARAKYPDDQDKRIEYFYKVYDHYIELSRKYLQYRYDIIAHKKVKNFPFLMGQGLWMDSEKLGPEDEIGSVLKHASISIGFCGLAECLVALTGHHHGESEDAQKLGLEIVRHLRKKTDEYTEKYHMNWACFSTPAESTAGDFMRACQKKYGKIPGITEHGYETNSFHVPVYYHTSAKHKIDIEAPYHAECNAG